MSSVEGKPSGGEGCERACRVSVVIPVYRNASTLRELRARVAAALSGVGPSELIFVDDGCDGGSNNVLRELSKADNSVVVIDMGANHGQHAAALAGLARSRGEWTVVLDADLQDPPEAIPHLIAAAAPGVDAVFAGRRGAYESPLRLLSGRTYRLVLRLLTGTPSDAGAFVALSRQMVGRLLEMQEVMPHRPPALVAMIGSTGLRMMSLPVERNRRPRGRSAYTSRHRVRSAANALTWIAAWQLRTLAVRAAGHSRASRAVDAPPTAVAHHNASQLRYFERAVKPTMVPRHTRYLNRHVDELLAHSGIRPGDRVLEVGCGMGRYTLLLAERGVRIEGLDLSQFLLDRLAEFDGGHHDIPLHCADVLEPPAELLGAFDAVVGLFVLHHLHDIPASLRSIARLLRPGGRVVFCEPNPYNPLYYVQIATSPGMSWEGDGGIVGIRRRRLVPSLTAAGFGDVFWERFGFLPPFAANSPLAALERPLEAFPLWRSALPFQLFGGRLHEHA